MKETQVEEMTNFLVELVKSRLEIYFDDLFQQELPKWEKFSKKQKRAFLAVIGKKWILEKDNDYGGINNEI